jgi:hypothetical protein
MQPHESVRVTIEFQPTIETISGSVGPEGAAASPFYGWLELIDRLERLVTVPRSASPSASPSPSPSPSLSPSSSSSSSDGFGPESAAPPVG